MTALIRTFAACVTLAFSLQVAAQQYPSGPVKVVVPYPPGGVVDVITRAVTDKIAEILNQPVIVDARPGGNGYIGTLAVKNAPPDGHTLLAASTFVVVAPIIDSVPRFRHTDFEAVAMIGGPPNVFVVPASLPVNSLQEFVAYAKARPGKLNTAMMGIGGSNHLGMEAFMQINRLDLMNVSYQGAPPAIPDLVAGRLDIVLAPLSVALPSIHSGRLKPLAVNAPTRLGVLPNVPTMIEAGFPPESVVMPWFGIMAPQGTPRLIIERLDAAMATALSDPQVQQRLQHMNAIVTPLNASDFATFLKRENARWTKLVKDRNIRAEK